jgi:hypothetical protein
MELKFNRQKQPLFPAKNFRTNSNFCRPRRGLMGSGRGPTHKSTPVKNFGGTRPSLDQHGENQKLGQEFVKNACEFWRPTHAHTEVALGPRVSLWLRWWWSSSRRRRRRRRRRRGPQKPPDALALGWRRLGGCCCCWWCAVAVGETHSHTRTHAHARTHGVALPIL